MRKFWKNPAVIVATTLGILLVVLGVCLIVDHFLHDDTAVADVTFDDDILRIDWSKYQTYDLVLADSVEITRAGVYQVTGEIADGNITVNTNDNVKLEFADVKVTNSQGPAIYVKNAKNVVLAAAAGTENYFTDGENYNGYETDEIGAIFSHDDLLLEGEGKFVITGNCEDAIVSKDDLVFASGSYKITAADDGIRGKDSVVIQGGDFTIEAGGDGIKSTNATEAERGFVYAMDGNFDIVAELDGIQAETTLKISGGTYNIKTGGGSSVKSTQENWGNWGRMPMNNPQRQETQTTETSSSAKGMKGTDVLIENGTFELNCADDAVHANGNLQIVDGKFAIASGDDGMHADDNLTIDGGTVKITQSYEGIEGQAVTINGGSLDIVATDDGINAAGGRDASSMNRPGANKFSADSNAKITVNGGEIVLKTSGDSIDSNGDIYLAGGKITITGPTNGSDNALDHDGGLVISGGTMMISEVAGLTTNGVSKDSASNVVIANFSTYYNAGTVVTLEDSNGTEIFRLKTGEKFNSVTFSSAGLLSGETYKLKVDGELWQSFTVSSNVTTLGNSANGGGMMNPGGDGGAMEGNGVAQPNRGRPAGR